MSLTELTHSNQLTAKIKLLGKSLGFAKIGIARPHVNTRDVIKLTQWLQNNNAETLAFMQKNAALRANPIKFIPWVKSIICCRFDYKIADTANNDYISSYALCRDYHDEVCARLEKLVKQIQQFVNTSSNTFNFRIFCDSSPVLEKALAAQAGLGWVGKNTLLLNKDSGSDSFLGEIYTDLIMPEDKPINELCGNCTKCLDACPTKALSVPYSLNANRCIAYLTIEHKGKIPEDLRPLIGTKIFGCTECQKCCPWNKKNTNESTFIPFPQLQNLKLEQLLQWDENTYKKNTEGTPLHRLGYERWRRNIIVALNNK